MQTSVGNVWASQSWDVKRMMFIDNIKKIRIIIREYNIALLLRVEEEIAKQLTMKKKKRNLTKTMHRFTS